MAELLEYDVAVVGLRNVDRALAGLERRFAQHNARMGRVTGTTASGRPIGGSRSAAGAMHGPGRKEQMAAIRAQERAQVQAERSRAREAIAGQRRETSERLKAERQRARESKRRQAEEIRHVRQTARASSAFARSTVGNASGRVGGVARSVGGAAAAMTGIAGAGLAAGAVFQAGNVDEEIRRMLVGGRAAGQSTGHDPDSVRKSVMATAIGTGVDPGKIAASMRAYVSKTGDVNKAVEFSDVFATVAQANDADPAEVAMAAAGFANNLGITDKAGMSQALATATFQGKSGSFEFKNQAELIERITAGFKAKGVGGLGVEGARNIGGLAQIVQGSTGEAAVTATAMDSIFRQFVSKGGEIQNGGFGEKMQVFKGGDSKQGLREDIGGLIADVLRATEGDAIKLQKIFGDEGMKGMNPFVSTFRNAGGGEAGSKAVTDQLSEYIDVQGTYADVQEDAKLVMQASNVQMEIFKSQVMDLVASKVFPEFQKLQPKLVELLPAIGSLVDAMLSTVQWLAENPWKGLGLLVGGAILMELGKAAIGAVVGQAITSMVTAAMAPGAMAMATVSVSTGLLALLPALAMLGAAAAAAGAAWLAIDQGQAFLKENGGAEGFKGMLGIGTEGWGFDGIDEAMNRQAKERRAAMDAVAPGAPANSGFADLSTGAASGAPGAPGAAPAAPGGQALSGSAADLKSAAEALKGAAAGLRSSGLNRGDAPSPPVK